MQNVSPFPIKTTIIKLHKQKDKSNQPQQFSYIKFTLAVVIGNGIVLAGLFGMLLLYLITSSPFVD